MNALEATIFHIPMGFISLFLTFNSLNLYNIENVIQRVSTESLTLSVFYIGSIYFIVDTYLMLKNYVPRHNIYFFHHFLGLISLIITYFYKWNYARYVVYYMTFELSTPIYNLTYVLHKRGYTAKNWFYWLNQWVFATLFTIIRVLFGTYITISLLLEILYDNTITNYYMVFPIALQSLMYYWFYCITNKLL